MGRNPWFVVPTPHKESGIGLLPTFQMAESNFMAETKWGVRSESLTSHVMIFQASSKLGGGVKDETQCPRPRQLKLVMCLKKFEGRPK